MNFAANSVGNRDTWLRPIANYPTTIERMPNMSASNGIACDIVHFCYAFLLKVEREDFLISTLDESEAFSSTLTIYVSQNKQHKTQI